ncbi:hypothetical protein [Microcystis phage Mae-JY02]
MAYQFSVAVRNASLDAIETTIGVSPTLEIRTGQPPASCAAADTGTVVATLPLPSDFMAAASAGSKALAGTWQDTGADTAGRAGHFRVKQGATCHWQGLVSDAWQASRAYAIGDQVTNGGNLYRATAAGTSASSGGPTGTGASITDGGVTWTFVQVGADMSLDNATINSGQQVTINTATINAGGA